MALSSKITHDNPQLHLPQQQLTNILSNIVSEFSTIPSNHEVNYLEPNYSAAPTCMCILLFADTPIPTIATLATLDTNTKSSYTIM